MNQEIFADAISAVHVTGNMVRIDLMSLQPQLKSDNGQPVFDISRRIIMPLDGFIKSIAVQEQVLQQLIAAGTVKKAEPAAPVATPTLQEQPQGKNKKTDE